MKKILFLLSVFLFAGLQAQGSCATDFVNKQLEEKYPEIRQKRLANEQKLRSMNISAYMDQIGASFSSNGDYTGQIYEIPVVVHVIEATGRNTPTDAQIEAWIDRANQMYAGTYPGYFPAGAGINESAVIPFKLVLAKRNPQCIATSGIIRYDGDNLAGYQQYGLGTNAAGGSGQGASENAIVNFAPHWPEADYYNMYVITGFNGNYTGTGLMGYAYYPDNPDAQYHTFMKSAVVTNADDCTLAHEFGHSIGLKHPFYPADPNGGECPPNNNCQTDNDQVCDTEPCESLLNVYQAPTNNDINPCTGQNYQGVQYNIMNYTPAPRKFTPGQRTRALVKFMQSRESLTYSLGGTAPVSYDVDLLAANCAVTGLNFPNNVDNVGPRKVVLGTINNVTPGCNDANEDYYIDYIAQSCSQGNVSTTIQKNEESTLKVKVSNFPQYIRAWIDYNNNGIFEDSEVIANGPNSVADVEHEFAFTPPASVVLNTNLRMRVAADYLFSGTLSSCGQYNLGQAEDYMVKVIDGLSVDDVNGGADTYTVVYESKDNTIRLVDTKEGFGNYQIFDFSGKLIQQGSTKEQVIKLNNNTKGGYLIKFEHKGKTASFKFLR